MSILIEVLSIFFYLQKKPINGHCLLNESLFLVGITMESVKIDHKLTDTLFELHIIHMAIISMYFMRFFLFNVELHSNAHEINVTDIVVENSTSNANA